MPEILLLCYYYYFYFIRIIPESPRWYLSQGKYKEAENVIKRIARGNKKILQEKALVALKADTPETGRVWHLFNNRVLLVRTLIILINW